MARVFGVLETLLMASVGVGALLTPVLIDWIGREEAFIVIGASLPIVTLAAWRRLRTLDARTDPPQEALELLQSLPIFSPLALITQEQLAEMLQERQVGPNEAVTRQGDTGADEFFIVADGVFRAYVDGDHARPMTRGDCFGEIALLRDSPRTATVLASPAGGRVYVLGRAPFLAAVNGTVTGAAAADELVNTRLPTRLV
jgi:hypothetical protein